MSNVDKQQKKALKKAYKTAKKKTVSLWKTLGIIAIIFSIILWPLYVVLNMFDNTLAAFVGGSFWKLENEDPNAQYFSLDYNSVDELAGYGDTLVQQIEAEGAALLLNNNNAMPLAASNKVSCFSTSSVNLVYGGTGSGNIDASSADNLQTALTKAGFEVNDTLWKFYTEGPAKDYKRANGSTIATASAVACEAPWNIYTEDVLSSVANYGDAAIVVLSRVGGEGADLDYSTVNYLALDSNEKDMLEGIKAMKEAGTVKKTIVLINSANAFQVDFLKNNIYDIDACLWIGDVGITGINAVAEILSGKVTPSGSLVDTYCYDNMTSPAMQNFTPVIYDGDISKVPEKSKSYMIYQEGIYVGYKYYETRYEDAVMGTGNTADYKYGDDVAFPFGYGLSYTDFEYSDMKVYYNQAADQYEVNVKVTNTGSTFGKEPVQVYVQSPYTAYDVTNKVEKASVALVGFGKTAELQPGQSETLNIVVDRRDIASYDAYGAGTYILDAGDYYLTAASNAHEAVNNILAAKGFTTADGMDAAGNADLTYKWEESKLDTTTYSTSLNGTEIKNQLSDSDPVLYDGVEEEVTMLSRSDWTGTFPKTVKIALTEILIDALQEVQYDPADYESVEMPITGAAKEVTLYDMIGKDYDDPAWEKLLNQMTYDEMVSLIGDAFHWTMPVLSVNAPGTRDENGPQGLTASLLGSGKTQLKATAFTSEDVMAATFNTDLMTEVGKVIGNDCVATNIACLYGPGNNIHRTPYGGRNFEYYSEDGFLSGKMSQYEVAAIQEKGVHVVMKHFALNDCEQDRIGLGVWLTEQAAREIYLKAFQAPLEVAGGNGVMTAYTRFGAIWSGGCKGLMTGILRQEWGNVGMNITDNVLTTYVNGVDGLMAGGVTIFDAMMPYVLNQLPDYADDPVIVSAAREACHHNLYAIANSVGMNGVGSETVVKTTSLKLLVLLRTLAIVFTILAVVMIVLWIIGSKKFKATPEYKEYRDFIKASKSA